MVLIWTHFGTTPKLSLDGIKATVQRASNFQHPLISSTRDVFRTVRQILIYSKSDGEPNAGIWLLFRGQQRRQQRDLDGQPVRINADLVEWVVTPPIDGSGWHCLGPNPYKYTTDLGGRVFATNDTVADSKWFLRPTDEENTYIISIGEVSNFVWTAVDSEKPVLIEPLDRSNVDNTKQMFKIVPILMSNK